MVSAVLMYAAGSEKEKGAGGRLHGGIIAHLFVFCNRGMAGASDSGVRPLMGTDGFVLACALDQRRVWLGVRRCPTWPTLQRFLVQGDTPCTPGGGCAPCTPLGERRGASSPAAEYGGKDKMRLLDGWSSCGLRPPSADRSGLTCAVVPPGPPSNVFWYRGTPPVPPAGAAPPAPRLGNGGALPHLPLSTGGRTRCACWTGGLVVACALLQRTGPAWRAPLSHRPTLRRF